MRRQAVLLSLAVLATGCAFSGPGALRTTRTEYNLAIQQTNEQELLLNLVRLRYRDSLYFLSVEKIAASAEYTGEVAASASLSSDSSDVYSLGPGRVSVMENPTVFYTPLNGERFALQMMSLINPEVLVPLANSGWSIERLLRVMLQGMNGYKNAPTAAGPTPDMAPEYRDFQAIVRLLRSLQQRALLEVSRTGLGEQHYLELMLAPESDDDAEVVEFRRLLGLSAEVRSYPVVPGIGPGDGEVIKVVPRSMIGILNYLSQAVNVPARDAEAGLVTVTRSADGSQFDWLQVFDRLFQVSAALESPAGAAVAVRYRDAWFYLRDDDLDSKSTFSLLAQLMALQSGSVGDRELPMSFSIGR